MATPDLGFRLLWLLLAALLPCLRPAAQDHRIYVGTYTRGESEGIYVLDFDSRKGPVGAPRLAAPAGNPSFLALSPDGRHLYAVGETARYGNQDSGSAAAFRIRPDGSLEPLGRKATGGGAPCHLHVDPSGRSLLAANYLGGSVAVFPLEADGSLGERSDLVRHLGSSLHPRRQRAPHAHCVRTDPSGRFAACADLGIDKVLVYPLDPRRGRLDPSRAASAGLPPGTGPRHLAFHPVAPLLLVNGELDSTLSSFRYRRGDGALEPLHRASTLPPLHEGGNSTAGIRIHPLGRFVYVSNRGHDSIALFHLDPGTGELDLVECGSTLGRTPRSFALDPRGEWLVAANQGSGSLAFFRIDPGSGRLRPQGGLAEVPSPACVLFHRLGR